MFKFLHAADIHLDSPLRGLDRYDGAPVDECRLATRRALENLVRVAVDERVAFVLIAGDLYDGDWEDFNTGLFFSKQMARLLDEKINVFLIRGNHDAANKMTRELRSLGNVRFLSTDRPETVLLEDVGVAIHGQGYSRQDVRENLARTYPHRTAGFFNIGMLHTCVDGRDGHDPYAPCALDDLRCRGYGYWALGHIHEREELNKKGDPPIMFCGNLQGRHVKEAGPKGCLLVTVDDAHNVVTEPRWLDVLRWATCVVDASGADDVDKVLARFHGELPALLNGAEGRLLALRVELQGDCRAHAALAADSVRLTNEIRNTAIEAGGGRIWVEKTVSRTRPHQSSTPALADDSRAELTAFLNELRSDEAQLKELAEGAAGDLLTRLKRDPELLGDREIVPWLRDLLEQVGPMLMSRLDVGGAGEDE
jgi:DNA repair exonuclease SbcCD nuclease subunit